MDIEQALRQRSEGRCELCGASGASRVYKVPPAPATGEDVERMLLLCPVCHAQIDDSEPLDVHHWHCLSESMWTPAPAVQVVAWRMLRRLDGESWARDLLDRIYLDPDTLAWAESGVDETKDEVVCHRDCHGVALETGDTVVLTKDLPVKGAGFTAKRGTAVRRIRLVADEPTQIEGRVDGRTIVILTRFVRKSG